MALYIKPDNSFFIIFFLFLFSHLTFFHSFLFRLLSLFFLVDTYYYYYNHYYHYYYYLNIVSFITAIIFDSWLFFFVFFSILGLYLSLRQINVWILLITNPYFFSFFSPPSLLFFPPPTVFYSLLFNG